MANYVDELKGSDGTMVRVLMMSNDSIAELNEMAVKLGLPETVFKKNTLPHFVITHDQRDQAVQLGAIPIKYADPQWRRVHAAAVKIGRNILQA